MSFTVTVENDLLMLETGVDWLILEDGLTNLLQEVNTPLDLGNYLLYGSSTLKFNTFDAAFLNPPTGAFQLGDTMTTTDPAWTGVIAALTSADASTVLRNNQVTWTLTATNARTLPNDTAPFDLSDTPVAAASGDYLLEDGSGHYMIESGTDFAPGALLLEQALSYGYSYLTVQTNTIPNAPNKTLGRCTVQQPGLRPGNTVHVTSLNQGLSAAPYQVTQAAVTWGQGANPPVPVYLIEMGDTPQTLAQWTQLTAPVAAAALTAPAVVPLGKVIYGNITAAAETWPIGGGIVTIASASFTVSAPVGHSLTVQLVGQIDALAYAWDNYIAVPRRAVRGTISGGIYTGAWVELPGGWTGTNTSAFRQVIDLSSAPGIALASGTYTITIDIDTQEANQLQIFSGFAQAAVTTV